MLNQLKKFNESQTNFEKVIGKTGVPIIAPDKFDIAKINQNDNIDEARQVMKEGNTISDLDNKTRVAQAILNTYRKRDGRTADDVYNENKQELSSQGNERMSGILKELERQK
jgi:hypothetical protein